MFRRKSTVRSKIDEAVTDSILWVVVENLKGMPHTIKIERRENELVVHLALLDGPHAKLPHGVLLHSEGWIDIGYGLRMFLVVGSANTTYQPPKLDERKGFFGRLFAKKPDQPLLEAK